MLLKGLFLSFEVLFTKIYNFENQSNLFYLL